MKKLIFSIAAVAMIFATSCKKENVNEPETVREPESNEFCAEIDNGAVPQNMPAVKDGMTTKTYFAGNSVKWESGDIIKVNGNDNTTWTDFTCTVTPGAGSSRAYFSNGSSYTKSQYHAFYGNCLDLTGKQGANGTLSASQTYETTTISSNQVQKLSNLPMYAYSTNHWLTFQNICGVLKITVPSYVSSANTIVVKTTEDNNGAFTVRDTTIESNSYKYAKINNTSAGNNTITVTKTGTETTFSSGEVIYVSMPAGTYNKLNIQFKNGNDSVWGTGPSSQPRTIVVNKIHNVNFGGAWLLSGEFSVSATQKVRFTKGNLYYDRDAQQYGLEASQVDFPTSWVNNHVGWFFAYENVEDATLYKNDENKGRSYLFCNSDHTITVNGVSGLYCLSYNQWNHLLNDRNNATSLRKHNVSVDGKTCMVIAPDNFIGSLNSSYTLDQANNLGLVVLPYCGTRLSNKNSREFDTQLQYFSSKINVSTNKVTVVRVETNDKGLDFVDAGISGSSAYSRPIRLVQNVTSGN